MNLNRITTKMFWILRRTGAVNFFNSINNNYSSKSNSNNNAYTERNSSRPPRRNYGRLSMDSDDTNLQKCETDDDLLVADLDNSYYHNSNVNSYDSRNSNSNSKNRNNKMDDNGNSNSLDADENANNLNGTESDLELDNIIKKSKDNEHVDESTISRLQAMALSDDDEYDESLTCNVCDRAFHCHRQLASHQQKKRHFGCSGCDSLFPSLMLLEHHKEEFEHWSDVDDDNNPLPCCRRNRRNDYEYTDSETGTSDAESEDLERLL